MFALPVRARCDRLNGTMHEVYRCLLGIRLASRMLKTRCRCPTSRHPCPDRGTAEPSCTPLHAPRAAQAPVYRTPHPPCPAGTTSAPRARANTCAPSRRLSLWVHTL